MKVHEPRVDKNGYLDFKARLVSDSEGRRLVKWECPKCDSVSYETNIEAVKEYGIGICYHCCTMWQ